MRKRAAVICIVLVLVLIGSLAVIAPASGGQAQQRIAAMSHEHPTGQNFSYVCAKIRGVPGRSYIVVAAGSGLMDDPPKRRVRLPNTGVDRVDFGIDQPGMYTFKLRRPGSDRIIDRMSYSVPPPPPEGAARGPFSCTSY